jgi:hypothetical protein
MRPMLTAFMSLLLLTGLAAGASAAKPKKKHYYGYSDNSPSAIAARQRNARTFDETQYYERDSRRIPIGTRAWWDQKEFEGPRR